ncbi:hypothetical protein SAMN05216276_1014154 [Streptosporangium subroseum]|uniref:Uncharacterized protein n=1 Tax=Streptosporangium subroseum TaxID=106412 RepID=A0A239GU73_9ACTN|nr:hypothetical protein SAMN05216276_1014154 [Streptosporangium subroseum]
MPGGFVPMTIAKSLLLLLALLLAWTGRRRARRGQGFEAGGSARRSSANSFSHMGVTVSGE